MYLSYEQSNEFSQPWGFTWDAGCSESAGTELCCLRPVYSTGWLFLFPYSYSNWGAWQYLESHSLENRVPYLAVSFLGQPGSHCLCQAKSKFLPSISPGAEDDPIQSRLNQKLMERSIGQSLYLVSVGISGQAHRRVRQRRDWQTFPDKSAVGCRLCGYSGHSGLSLALVM